MDYNELQAIYNKYFSLNFLGPDINNKFALISLTCYITQKIRNKKPEWTYWRTLHEINKGKLSEDYINVLAIICSDFAYGCKSFPTFGIPDKSIPSKIKELLDQYIPF